MKKTSKSQSRDKSRQLAALRDPLPFIIGGLSHDISNLLGAVILTYENVLFGLQKRPLASVREELVQMEPALHGLSNLLSLIGELCRPFYTDTTTPPLVSVVPTIIRELRSNYKDDTSNFSWSIQGGTRIPHLNFPPMALLFILNELIANSKRASKLVKRRVRLNLTFDYSTEEGLLTLRATDNGKGFSKSVLKSQRIERDQKYGGLKIVMDMAYRMHGWATLGKVPQGGALVDIAFPVSVYHE